MSNKMFKLISSEFVISGIVEETNSDLTLCDPMVVQFTPNPEGQLGICLFPLNPFASQKNENLKIDKSNILFYVETIDDGILKEYIKMTSGLTLS